jgi:V8-like Glu-specific endopeptidase
MATTAAAPTGLHSPVTNQITEATTPQQEMLELPSIGVLGDEDPLKGELENLVHPPPRAEAAGDFWQVPDTSGLLDIGAASFGSRPLLETVHGIDNRVRIQTTSKYPWRINCSLLITARDNSRWVGTAWFIGPRTLVTAGHCVYIKNSGNPAQDGWVKSIQVMPGRNESRLPFGAVTSNVFWTVKGWADGGEENYDYAAIILPSDLGSNVGTYGFAALPDNQLMGKTAHISGYPGDKPSGTQWYDKHEVASVNPNKVHYDIDTAGGQSGAAVYVVRGGRRIAVAVHAYGGPTTNSGTRISAPVFANLTNWKAL